jgi:hypothetical protein
VTYSELQVTTHFSFLRGASSPEELFLTAAMICSAMASQAATISKRRIAYGGNDRSDVLFVTIGGREKAIAKDVRKSWLIEGGRAILYSNTDGPITHANEDVSLWRYDAGSGRRKELLCGDLITVVGVSERRARSGKIALVVEISEMHGEPSLAVVHPRRGQVWGMYRASLIAVRNGHLTVGDFTRNKVKMDADYSKIKPERTFTLDLDKVLRRKTMKLQNRND